jgi:hypothetical protein
MTLTSTTDHLARILRGAASGVFGSKWQRRPGAESGCGSNLGVLLEEASCDGENEQPLIQGFGIQKQDGLSAL